MWEGLTYLHERALIKPFAQHAHHAADERPRVGARHVPPAVPLVPRRRYSRQPNERWVVREEHCEDVESPHLSQPVSAWSAVSA